MKKQLIILILLSLSMTSFKKDEFQIDNDTIQVSIKHTESYTYSTGIAGDEDGASIMKQANYFEISELRRNQSTNFEVIFFYKPKTNFTANDYVEIETFEGSDGANPPIKMNTVKILINVTNIIR